MRKLHRDRLDKTIGVSKMENSLEIQRFNKIHKINLLLTYAIIVLLVGSLVLAKGIAASQLFIFVGLAIAAISTGLYFIKLPQKVKALLFALIPATVISALFIIDGYALNKHYILIFTIVMVALYFDQKLISILTSFLYVYTVAIYLIDPAKLLGENHTITMLITVIILLVGTSLALYSLTSAGNTLIESSRQKQNEATNLYAQVEEILQSVNQSARHLDEKVKVIYASTEEVSVSSTSLNEQSLSVTKAIQEEMTMIAAMFEQVEEAQNVLSHSEQVSKRVVKEATSANEQIVQTVSKMDSIKPKMTIMNDSIETTVHTVEDLKNSLDQVNTLLSGIKGIADQTNLLALNASIEAARAGEHGKGFAVVAEEVRKLAEQSNHFASEITTVTANLYSNSNNAYEQSLHGKEAMLNVNEGLLEVEQTLTTVQSMAHNMQSAVEESTEYTSLSTQKMDETKQKLKDTLTLSENNSTIIETMQYVIQEEDQAIQNISHSMLELEQLSNELTNLSNK
jgi:methyl-accepting chemotaxis protein